MKNIGIKQLLITDLISKGFDFDLNPFVISDRQASILADYARQIGYREPKNGYFDKGRAFFVHLKNIYQKDRLIQDDLKNF